jgi:hypothetical protein
VISTSTPDAPWTRWTTPTQPPTMNTSELHFNVEYGNQSGVRQAACRRATRDRIWPERTDHAERRRESWLGRGDAQIFAGDTIWSVRRLGHQGVEPAACRIVSVAVTTTRTALVCTFKRPHGPQA